MERNGGTTGLELSGLWRDSTRDSTKVSSNLLKLSAP
jgi:hypothetical protein